MSEFNFPCPACGRDISADTAHAGEAITCPLCRENIIVPESGSPVSPAPIVPPWTGHLATSAQPQTSGLAIASLVCSLSSLITCIGWLPGIICGHLAKSQLRRNSSLKGKGFATTGLAIGYLLLAIQVGGVAAWMWYVASAAKQGFNNMQQSLATNHIIITQNSTTVSNDAEAMETVQMATNSGPQTESAHSEWMADISGASFPNHPASGKVHGMDFIVRRALFRNGELRINSANGLSVAIVHLSPAIAGKSYEIESGDDTGGNPQVRMSWKENGAVQGATFDKGYGLKLDFGPVDGRRLSGKIYVCLPDNAKSYVAGSFQVRLPKPKT